MGVQTFWAIKGKHGFYVGTHLRRVDMIAIHINGRFRFHPSADRPGLHSALDADQLSDWKICKSQGDRAVKVVLTEVTAQEPTP